jgi:hypothetical protein
MKNLRRSVTAYPKDAKSVDTIVTKVSKLLDAVVPNSIVGMIALAVEQENSLIFYNRWALVLHNKNDYEIYDLYTKNSIYKNVALFTSALNIIFNLQKFTKKGRSIDKIIYSLDQQYYRCLEDIRVLNKKVLSNKGNVELNEMKLLDRQHRLHEIKTQLSKVY